MHYSLLDTLDYRLDQAAPFNTTLALANVPVSSLNITSSTQAFGRHARLTFHRSDRYRNSHSRSRGAYISSNRSRPTRRLRSGYIGSHGYHQILSADLNEPAATIVNGVIYYPTTNKANPAVANTTSWISQGLSNYNGLVVDVRRSLARGLQIRGNYTFSKNLDNGSAWNTSVSANTPAFVSYPADPSIDYGRAATDIRHLVAINGTYDLPIGRGHIVGSNLSGLANRAVSGWTLSTIVALQSGFPFSPQLGYNPTGSGDTRNPVRPDVNPNFHGNLYPRTPQQFFNPAAFLAPAYGTVGNLGRDTLTGPGLANADVSVAQRHAGQRTPSCTIPGGIFQCSQPHELCDTKPGCLHLRADAGERSKPNYRCCGQPNGRGHHRDSNDFTPDPVRAQTPLLALLWPARRMAIRSVSPPKLFRIRSGTLS